MTDKIALGVEEDASKFALIAMIDDDFRALKIDRIPEEERIAVLDALQDLEVLAALANRGISEEDAKARPDDALEALTNPDSVKDLAHVKIYQVARQTADMIDSRQKMRQTAELIRGAGNCKVEEFAPEADLNDIEKFDVVFIDYYMDRKDPTGTMAENIARAVQNRQCAARSQQIVLMSSLPGVREKRSEFRKNASIEAASFVFVAKADLDEDWKVKAHLEMLGRGMQHSAALGDYISEVKRSVRDAAERLSEKIDDLDIDDFAYVQRIALQADGHPLGDYLSWLLSSHLTSLAFEGITLRKHQAAVDRMAFTDEPLSLSEPSIEIATLYHDALFARNLGPLEGHPRAESGSVIHGLPFVQLGDVFLTANKDRAVVVLSAACDLALSMDPKRPPDRNFGVSLLFGEPNSVANKRIKGNSFTEGVVDGAKVYRINWRFSTFQTVPLSELTEFLKDGGFDLSKRDRLRALYSLKLQHELGNHLMRVGPPVTPPISRHSKSKIFYCIGTAIKELKLGEVEVVISFFKEETWVRLTTLLVTKLKEVCARVLDDMRDQLRTPPGESAREKKARKSLAQNVSSLESQLAGTKVWMSLLGSKAMPKLGGTIPLNGFVHLAHGTGWEMPAQPAIVLVINDNADAAAPGNNAGDPINVATSERRNASDAVLAIEDPPSPPAHA